MRKIFLTCLSISFQLLANTFQLNAQCRDCQDGKYDKSAAARSAITAHLLPPDSSGGLAQSYILQNVCGLNWTQASVEVTTRYTPTLGSGLPCMVPLVYNSCNVDSVIKAFLYFSGSYLTPYAANPASVSITNPAASVFTYAADSIGTGPSKCWGEIGSIAYRVDVTNCIGGGGNYVIDLSGEGITSWAIDGITLVVIYADKTASYSGSIILYDGLYVTTGRGHAQIFSGFNVCNATPSGQAFALLSDMQSNVNNGINTETYNGTTVTDSNLFYNFCNIVTPLAASQTSTTYSVYTNNGGDCYAWLMAGLYWQNTTCMTCVPSIAGLTLSCNSTAASCGNNGTANVMVTGATTPLTYMWTPGGQTSDTATGLSSGTYTVYISDSTVCAFSIVTVGSNKIVLNTTQTPANCANPGTANVYATGGFPPYSYLWSPGGQTNATASGLLHGIYRVYVTDSTGCIAKDSVTVPEDSLRINTYGFTEIFSGDSAYIYTLSNIPSLITSWSWAPSASVTNPDSNHSYVDPVVTTTYTVTATTLCGTITDTVTIFIACANTYSEPICIATIDTSNNKAEVIWGRTNSPPQGGSGQYNIYKDSTSGYELTHSQPLNVLSEFVDNNSNPTAAPVSYELATVDSCGESALSLPATTIFLTITSATNAYILNWTAYVGFTPSIYRIFRGPALNAMVQIDSVNSSTLTCTDSFPPLGSFYAVEAVNPSGTCIPTAKVLGHKMRGAMLSGSFSNGFNTAVLGAKNITNAISNLNIYPNPSNGMLNLNYSISGSGNIRISIMDELGQVVYDNTETKNAGSYTEQINLENLSTGIYILHLQSSGGSVVKKIVIMKR